MKPVLCLLLGFMVLLGGCAEQAQEPVAPGDFGPVVFYQPSAAPKGLVLMLSGDTGWGSAFAALGNSLAALGYLVAGVDSRPYLQRLHHDRRPCVPLGLDLDHLVRSLQQQHGMAKPPPILVGMGQGAAMVYAAAAQMPADHFHAVVSLDFCPTLVTPKPLCAADGFPGETAAGGHTRILAATPQMQTPWFVFQNRQYPGCSLETASRFIEHVANAKLVVVPSQPQQGSTTPEDWQPQFLALMQWLDPRISQQAQTSATLSGLPLIERPVAAGSAYLAVLLSGDGGWAAIDQGMASELGKRGVSTVGWDSLSYFWHPRTPEQAAADMERLLRHYLAAWDAQHVILIGYSFGADVLPFIVNRLPVDLRTRVAVLALLGLGARAAFAFHLTQWLGVEQTEGYPIAPELSTLHTVKVLCVFGEDETDSLCPMLRAPILVHKVPGNHHFNHDYQSLVSSILALVPVPILDSRGTQPSIIPR